VLVDHLTLLGERSTCSVQYRQTFHDLHCFQADDSYHLADEPYNVLRLILTVWIIDNTATLIGLDLVLVNDPVKLGLRGVLLLLRRSIRTFAIVHYYPCTNNFVQETPRLAVRILLQ